MPLGALALCAAAGASWAGGNVVTRRARPPRPLALVVWSSLAAPLPLAALSLGFEGPAAWRDAFAGLGASGLGALAYIVVVSTFFGYGTWAWLLGRHPASSVAPFTLFVPVVGIAAAWLALGERPGAVELGGASVVLVGLALVTGLLQAPPVTAKPWARRAGQTTPVAKRGP